MRLDWELLLDPGFFSELLGLTALSQLALLCFIILLHTHLVTWGAPGQGDRGEIWKTSLHRLFLGGERGGRLWSQVLSQAGFWLPELPWF